MSVPLPVLSDGTRILLRGRNWSSQSEANYLVSTWLESSVGCWPWPLVGDGTSLYFQKMRPLVEACLCSPSVHVTVACDPEDPDTIYGYVVHQPGRLLHVYVRHAARRLGLMTLMLSPGLVFDDDLIFCPFWTSSAVHLPGRFLSRPDLALDLWRSVRPARDVSGTSRRSSG